MAPTRDEDEIEALAGDAVGDVIRFWGFRKPLGRLWTVLLLAEEPLSAPEIAERLKISAGATSMNLSELERWGVVRRVDRAGHRRTLYEPETDVVRLVARVVRERERLLVRSVRERLERAYDLSKKTARKRAKAHRRLGYLLSIARIAETGVELVSTVPAGGFTSIDKIVQIVRTLASVKAA